MVRGKKKSEGETERSKNNLKQKEGNVEFLCHILFLVLILLLYIVSLDGVDYFLIFCLLPFFAVLLLEIFPVLISPLALNHKDFLPTALPDV